MMLHTRDRGRGRKGEGKKEERGRKGEREKSEKGGERGGAGKSSIEERVEMGNKRILSRDGKQED